MHMALPRPAHLQLALGKGTGQASWPDARTLLWLPRSPACPPVSLSPPTLEGEAVGALGVIFPVFWQKLQQAAELKSLL